VFYGVVLREKDLSVELNFPSLIIFLSSIYFCSTGGKGVNIFATEYLRNLCVCRAHNFRFSWVFLIWKFELYTVFVTI